METSKSFQAMGARQVGTHVAVSASAWSRRRRADSCWKHLELETGHRNSAYELSARLERRKSLCACGQAASTLRDLGLTKAVLLDERAHKHYDVGEIINT
jgi:hypothetical protein